MHDRLQSTKAPDWFDQWVRMLNMRPICRVMEPRADVLIADSGTSFKYDGSDQTDLVTPKGARIYRTAFALDRAGLQFVKWHNYPADHDPNLSLNERQALRVNEALLAARQLIRDLDEVDYWDEQPLLVH